MKFKILTGIMLILLSTAVVVRFVRPVEASGTIYIRADGNVEGTTYISTIDNITYTFTDNINDSIVVERDNIVVNGADYTLQGVGALHSIGIDLSGRNNVTIKNMKITAFYCGIRLDESSNNTIEGNNITTNNGSGIYLIDSSNNTISVNNLTANNGSGISLNGASINTISGNNITNNYDGINLYISSNNIISGNNITNNDYGISPFASSINTISGNNITANNNYGIRLHWSSNNIIYHNNFINNTQQVYSHNSTSIWDDGYPSGGNYWSNYTGVDANMDGVGDASYEIDSINIDHYPLMGMFSDFPVTLEEETYHATTVCNSTISEFEFDQVNRIIRFNVTGEEGIGFCRVCIPHDLIEPLYTATVDGYAPLYANYTLYDNGTHTWIYFTYQHSTHEVVIVPEFSSFAILPILMITTLPAVIIYRRKHTI